MSLISHMSLMSLMEETIQKTTEELLAKLEVEANITVDQDEQEDLPAHFAKAPALTSRKQGESARRADRQAYNVRIETPESGVLIGYHGQTLEAFQLILNLILVRKLEKWQRVVVDVGDYREKRRSYLESLAQQVADRVAQTGKEEILPEMSSFERRLIHLALAQHPNVTTQSTGETHSRRVIVKPK